jgi:hypothetical protein
VRGYSLIATLVVVPLLAVIRPARRADAGGVAHAAMD